MQKVFVDHAVNLRNERSAAGLGSTLNDSRRAAVKARTAEADGVLLRRADYWRLLPSFLRSPASKTGEYQFLRGGRRSR